MVSRYQIVTSAISGDEFEELRGALKGMAFLVTDIRGAGRMLHVTLNPGQTMDDLTQALPLLRKCEVSLLYP